MIDDLTTHENLSTQYEFAGLQRDPFFMRVHQAVGYAPEQTPFDLSDSPLTAALIPRRHQALGIPITEDLFK
jgi:hypothetical protein